MELVSLRTEYLVNPLGLDIARPRFYWKLRSDRNGASQTAYRILVSSTSGGDPDLWDSGWVESDETIHIEYGGTPLPSATRAFWRVEIKDDQHATYASEEAWWESGIEQAEWDAAWIGGDVAGGKYTSGPVAQLVKPFTLGAKPTKARLYITALGLYEAYLNGQRVGEDIFTPGWTVYSKRVRYQAYDVTTLLNEGQNTVAALLGDGWFCGFVGAEGRQIWGDIPRLMARLVVNLEDGSTATLTTDGSWSFSYGPYLESDLLMGEAYDATREIPNWNTTPDLALFRPVAVYPAPQIAIEGTRHPLVRVTQEIVPVAEPTRIEGWPGPRFIYDIGQNMVGRYRLKLKGKKGETVTIKSAEMLTKQGGLYTEALRSARATDYYTFAEDGEVTYEPTFTFHGFRYVQLSGLSIPPTKESVTGIVLGSDTEPTGWFECSDEQVNQLQRNIVWGQRGNFLEVPTDCPQRDERLGWTGDAQVFIRTASHNMDVASFFTKWLQDITDSQDDQGAVPPVIPNPAQFGGDGGPAWADAAIICPWTIYRCYGDKRLLSDHYATYKAFVDYLVNTAKDWIRVYDGYTGFRGFGDWLSTNADTPPDLIGTAFLAYSARLLSEVADALGNKDDQAKYESVSASAKAAFQRRYITPAGLVASHTQTAYVLALFFDLLQPEQTEEAVQALVNDIGKRNWHLSTGFVGTPYIQHVLTAAGRTDVAYRLLFQKTWPSWLYPVTQGATTIWERWDGWTEDKGFQTPEMNSFNHYAYGAVGHWLYATVAGLDLGAPAYKVIRFHPTPGEGLTHAKATLDSIRGLVESAWTIADGKFHYEVTVPPCCTAIVELPQGCANRAPISLGSGKHVIEAGYVSGDAKLSVPTSNFNAPE